MFHKHQPSFILNRMGICKNNKSDSGTLVCNLLSLPRNLLWILGLIDIIRSINMSIWSLKQFSV